jgi:hypothetical protein
MVVVVDGVFIDSRTVSLASPKRLACRRSTG